MSALIYILRKSFKNTVKGLIRKPAPLIAYVVIGGFIIIPSLLSGSPGHETGSLNVSQDVFKSVFMAYTVFLFVMSFVSSLNGASFFRMADVNMLFTAPLKAGYILIYGFIKQLALSLMVMFYVGLQYPNWKRSFGLTGGAGWILIAAYMLLVTVTSLLGMVLYAYVSRKPERVSAVKKIVYGFLIALIVPIIVNTFKTGNVLESITGWLAHDYLKFIPLLGWFREILMGAFTGMTTEIWLYMLFISVITIAAFIRIYLMDTDYYENVLAGTEIKEAMLKASKEGRAAQSNVQIKSIRKYRKVDAKFTLEGSLAIFQKQILEKRKKGVFLLPTRTIVLAVGAAIAALAIPGDGTELMLGILGSSAYAMLILTMATAWESDISYHYIYLIPATPFMKMLASTLTGVIYTLIEGILVFGIIGVILRAPLSLTLSAILAYTAIGTVFLYSDLVVRRMFGKIHANVLRIFFRIFLLVVIIAIAVTPAVIISLTTGNYALGLCTSAAVNIVLILLFMWIGTGLFVSPELP
jgi:hypothetical protein